MDHPRLISRGLQREGCYERPTVVEERLVRLRDEDHMHTLLEPEAMIALMNRLLHTSWYIRTPTLCTVAQLSCTHYT